MFTLAFLRLDQILIEKASELLTKVHHLGRKLRNAAHMPIWLGGKSVNVSALIRFFLRSCVAFLSTSGEAAGGLCRRGARL